MSRSKLLPFAIAALSALTLASCAGSKTVTYKITFSGVDPSLNAQLLQAARRVIERRVQALEVDLNDISIENADTNEPLMTVEVSTAEAADMLQVQLTRPFEIEIMAESSPDEADVTVDVPNAQKMTFKKMGIGNSDISWAVSRTNGGKGEISILFNEVGSAKMKELMKNNKGKNVGIFIQGQLVSRLLVQEETFTDTIIIRGVPSPELASTVADDISTGLHMTFTPVSE